MEILLYVLIAAVVGYAAVRIFGKQMTAIQPSDATIKKEIEDMTKGLNALWENGLADWNKNDLGKFSLEQTGFQKKKAIQGIEITEGVFMSTANEPICAYTYKKFVGPGTNALLVAMTADNIFIYRFTNSGVHVVADKERLGTIRKDGGFYDKKNDLVAEIGSGTKSRRILIGKQEVAKLLPPPAMSDGKTIPQALQLSGHQDIANNDALLIKVLTIYDAIITVL